MSLVGSPPAAPALLPDGDETFLSRPQVGRRVYVASEYGFVPAIPSNELYLDGKVALYAEVLARGYASVKVRDSQLMLQAGGFVGIIPVTDAIELDVRPRVPVDRLERLLRISGEAPIPFKPHRREYDLLPEQVPSLLDVLTDALLDGIAEIDANGLYREYQVQVEDTSFPRGRVLAGPTLTRHRARGAHHRAVASWFKHTADSAPNRCLKYAAWFMARRYAGMRPAPVAARQMLSRLNRAYRLFDGAEFDLSRRFLDDPLVREPARMPSVRRYYREPLGVAVAIIRDRGVSLGGRGDDILMTSLLVNMEDVFEGYVRAVLTDQLRARGPELLVLDGNRWGVGGGRRLLFNASPSPDATPDVVVRNPAPAAQIEHPLVLEVKYKPVGMSLDRDDLNQTITYGASYGAPAVVIVHPQSDPALVGIRQLGTIGSMTAYQYAFNLAAASLEAEEAAFGAAMAALASVL